MKQTLVTLKSLIILKRIRQYGSMNGQRKKDMNLLVSLKNARKHGNGSSCPIVLATIKMEIFLMQVMDVHGEEQVLAMVTVDSIKELTLRSTTRF